MPTYAYACTACEHRFEAVQAFTDASLTECPECHGRLRKLFNSVGIVFKGSGFYRTDSRAAATKGESPAKDTGAKESPAKEPVAAKSESSTSSSSSSASSSTTGSASSTTAAKAAP